MKLEEYKKLMGIGKKKENKYRNKEVVVDGIRFQSIKESNYYLDLLLAKKSGELINFYMQVPFKLPGKTKYILDFLEVWKGDVIRHIDTKGVKTQMFALKKRQVEELYEIEIEMI